MRRRRLHRRCRAILRVPHDTTLLFLCTLLLPLLIPRTTPWVSWPLPFLPPAPHHWWCNNEHIKLPSREKQIRNQGHRWIPSHKKKSVLLGLRSYNAIMIMLLQGARRATNKQITFALKHYTL